MSISTVIVAAGEGTRFGTEIKKQFYLLKGRPVVARTMHAFDRHPEINEIILVINKSDKDYAIKELATGGVFKKPVTVIEGGDMRQDSVFNGIKSVSGDIILIQDGVRPFISREMIDLVINTVRSEGAAICAIRENHTTAVGKNGYIHQYLDRNRLFRLQTPQGFKTELIKRALEKAYSDNYSGTDDSSLVVRIGEKVKIVEGSPDNIKITSREDIVIAEKIIEQRGEQYADRDWI